LDARQRSCVQEKRVSFSFASLLIPLLNPHEFSRWPNAHMHASAKLVVWG